MGLAEEEDDFDFKERFEELRNLLSEQIRLEKELSSHINVELNKIKLND